MVRTERLSAGCLVAGWLAAGCALRGSGAIVAPPPPDRPVPASEPRASVELLVDLEPGPRCEEDFDLGLYQDRGIQLIEWDDHTGGCQQRSIRVQYLPNRISEQNVIEQVRRLTRRAVPTPRGS